MVKSFGVSGFRAIGRRRQLHDSDLRIHVLRLALGRI